MAASWRSSDIGVPIGHSGWAAALGEMVAISADGDIRALLALAVDIIALFNS